VSPGEKWGEWIEHVIGTRKKAESGPNFGRHGYLRKKVRKGFPGVIVTAEIYPDFGTIGADQPHLWGVAFPEEQRVTKFQNGQTIEVRPHAHAKRFGRKEATLAAAKAAADECIRQGRSWDGLERNPNGALKVLDPVPSALYDDVPE